MPIILKKMQRYNPQKKDEPKKWLVVHQVAEAVGAEQIGVATVIRNVKINFKPGDELKAAMQKASFVWVEDLMGTSSSSSSSSSGTDDGDTDNGGSGTTGGNPL